MEWKHCLVHEKPKQKVPMLWRSDSAAHFFKGWPLLVFFCCCFVNDSRVESSSKNKMLSFSYIWPELECLWRQVWCLIVKHQCKNETVNSFQLWGSVERKAHHCACGWINQKSETRKLKSLPKTIFPLNYHSETGFVAVIVEGRGQNETVLKCSHFTQKTKHRLTGGLAWGSSPI